MQTDINSEQRKYWNSEAADNWVAAQSYIDESLAEFTQVAISQLGDISDKQILDVGCGCGTTSLLLNKAGAEVVGADISEPMLEVAKQRSQDSKRLTWLSADVSVSEFKEKFDLIFSRFGVMFFADPIAAFKNLQSALKPNGEMMFICWQEPSLNPWMAVGGRAVQPFMPPPETPVKSTDPGPFAFSDDDYTRDILTQAGFKNIEFRPISCGMNLGANITEAIENQCRVGPAARVMRELSGSKREQALDAMKEAIAPWLTEDGLILGASAWLVSATV